MVAAFVCCCKTYCACTLYYTALNARQAGQYGRNPPAGYCALTLQEKGQILQRTRNETSGHRAGQIETANTEGNQKRENCKPLSAVGLCCQQ